MQPRGRHSKEAILQVEYGGLNEFFYNLYAVTGDKNYADLAHRFDHSRLFDPLADGRDELKGILEGETGLTPGLTIRLPIRTGRSTALGGPPSASHP